MNKETQNLLSKIMALAYEVNEKTSTDVFVRFSGHVKSVDINWYEGGWSNFKTGNVVDGCGINGTIYLEDIKKINKAVDTLEGLLK